MGLRDAILTDYQLWENRETVEYRSVNADATYQPFDVTDCKFRNPTWKEQAASGGAVTGQDRVVLVPVVTAEAAGMQRDTGPTLDPLNRYPKPGDVVLRATEDAIQDPDNAEWTVLEAQLNTLETWWRLTCRNLVVAYHLRQTGTLKRPANTAEAAGNRNPGLATLREGIRCRVQEDGSTVAVDGDAVGGRHTRRRFTATFQGYRADVRAGDVLTVDGVDYTVTGSASFDRIDTLGTVTVERIE